MKTHRSILAAAALSLVIFAWLPAPARAATDDARIAVAVDCHTADSVGAGFCSAFKEKLAASPGYRLVPNTSRGYGIGVHFSSVDLWQGINAELAGHISAVSVAFTIYAEKLPGEVYEDSSVFRIGKDTFAEMSAKIIAALGQIVNLNASLFNQMRTEVHKAPQPSLKPAPSP